MRTRGRGARWTARGALALAALSTSCLRVIEPEETIIWQGSLQPAPEAPTLVLGTMSMVAEENVTLVGVGVHGAEAGLRLGWGVREGETDTLGP